MAPSGKRIVVIGAGVGGAGVAALLQARGHSVTLLERNLYVGGKCTSLEKNGYVCDYAFHLYSMGEAGPLGEINRRVRGELRWLRARPMGKMFFQDRGWMTLPATLGTALPYLGLAYAKGVLRPSVIKMLRSSVRNFGVMGLLDTVAKIARADAGFLHTIDRMSMRDFLLQFTDDKTMHRIMGIFSFLLVVIPYSEASAGEMLWCLVNMFSKSSLGYPQGGAREIAGSYARAFLRDGGSLRQGCAVKRILVRDGKARGVETEEGEQIPADVVISNAGIKSTLELAGEDQFPAEYASYVKNLKYSRSANIIKYGLDCTLPEVPRYFFQYMPAQSARQLDDFLEKGTDPDEQSFVIIKPTDFDPYLAPLGKQIVIAGKVGPSEVTPENIRFCEEVLDIAEKSVFNVFPRIKDHIEWKQRATIQTTSALTGRSTGECIGLAQCVGQTGGDKPRAATPVKDLWLVGSDAGARGVGTEMAAGSALYVSHQI